MVTVLSIDGGGIRGIIPAVVLEEFEKRTGRPICDMFDYIAGTSTGGILSCMLAIPNYSGQPRYTAAQIKELYIKLGGAVFRRGFLRFIYTLGGLTGVKYSARTLEKYLHDYLGNVKISAALTKIIITAYETRSASPWFFKSAFAKPFGPPEQNPPMKSAARATSAAPTYFTPYKMGREHCFVDGGLFANNPALCAYADARRAFPDEKEFLVVSFGTGIHVKPFSSAKLRRRGLLGWAPIILGMLQNSSAATVHYQMRTLINSELYREFQIPLDPKSEAMDNASPANIRRLTEAGNQLIKEQSAEIDDVCRILREHRKK